MFIDAHAHLDRYGALLDSALHEIEEHSILTIANSMDLESYRDNLAIARRSEWVLPTFGIHPRNAARNLPELSKVSGAIEQTPMIGEIGLDFHWVEDSSQYPAQMKVLEYFLAAAREQKKIVNLHTKGAERQILDLLERYDIPRAIIHWYSGPLDILGAMIDCGAYFTVGVEALYSEHIREIARAIPLRQILTETDNPGGLKWLRGVTGMPSIVADVVEAIAGLKEATRREMSQAVYANFLTLVKDDLWIPEEVTNLLRVHEHLIRDPSLRSG
jgi:TatD DNase family protein